MLEKTKVNEKGAGVGPYLKKEFRLPTAIFVGCMEVEGTLSTAKNKKDKNKVDYKKMLLAVVVAKLMERLLTTPEICGSNPFIG